METAGAERGNSTVGFLPGEPGGKPDSGRLPQQKVFAKQPKITVNPDPKDVEGFNKFMERYTGDWL